MTYDQIKISNQICHPLYSTTNALMRIYKPLLVKIGLTYPQYLVMMVLWEINQSNIQTISEMTYFDSGSLTPLLKKLNQQGFLTIKIDKNDKRNRIISLTSRGSALKEKAKDIPKELICMMNLDKTEILILKKMLVNLHLQIINAEQA